LPKQHSNALVRASVNITLAEIAGCRDAERELQRQIEEASEEVPVPLVVNPFPVLPPPASIVPVLTVLEKMKDKTACVEQKLKLAHARRDFRAFCRQQSHSQLHKLVDLPLLDDVLISREYDSIPRVAELRMRLFDDLALRAKIKTRPLDSTGRPELMLPPASLPYVGTYAYHEWIVCDMPFEDWPSYIPAAMTDSMGSKLFTSCWNLFELVASVQLVTFPFCAIRSKDMRPIRDRNDPFVDKFIIFCQPMIKMSYIDGRVRYIKSDLTSEDRLFDAFKFDRVSVSLGDVLLPGTDSHVDTLIQSWFCPLPSVQELDTRRCFSRLQVSRLPVGLYAGYPMAGQYAFNIQSVSIFMLNELLSRRQLFPTKLSPNVTVERLVRSYSEDSYSNSFSYWKLQGFPVPMDTVNLAVGVLIGDMKSKISDF